MTSRAAGWTVLDTLAFGLSAVAVMTLVTEWLWPHGLHAPSFIETAPPAEETGADVLSVGSIDEYRLASERPLFAPDRRPFVPPPPEAAPAQPVGPRAEFQLTAVILTGTTEMALLRSNLTPTVQRLAVNQILDGWVLAEVHTESVVLQRDSESLVVELRPDTTGSRTGQAVRIQPLASER